MGTYHCVYIVGHSLKYWKIDRNISCPVFPTHGSKLCFVHNGTYVKLFNDIRFYEFWNSLKVIAQTETIIKQQSIVQNKTGLDAMENSNINTLLELLSTIVETRIDGTATLLELTSKLPEVKNIQYVNSIDEKFMGIPPDLDLQKRNIARYILEQDKDIATISFLRQKGIYT